MKDRVHKKVEALLNKTNTLISHLEALVDELDFVMAEISPNEQTHKGGIQNEIPDISIIANDRLLYTCQSDSSR